MSLSSKYSWHRTFKRTLDMKCNQADSQSHGDKLCDSSASRKSQKTPFYWRDWCYWWLDYWALWWPDDVSSCKLTTACLSLALPTWSHQHRGKTCFHLCYHWDLMFHHDKGSCYNFIVNAPVCTKLYMFDKSPGLNTSTWQYSISDANWLNSAPYEISAKQHQQQAK